jgi:hypothetical protein
METSKFKVLLLSKDNELIEFIDKNTTCLFESITEVKDKEWLNVEIDDWNKCDIGIITIQLNGDRKVYFIYESENLKHYDLHI